VIQRLVLTILLNLIWRGSTFDIAAFDLYYASEKPTLEIDNFQSKSIFLEEVSLF
jgi:hypothetical protein